MGISTLVLECIDGKDDHLKIEISNDESIVLGNSLETAKIALQELLNTTGTIVLTNRSGALYFDASQSGALLKLNGAAATSGVVRTDDLLKIGDSIWKIIPAIQIQPTATSVRPTGFNMVRQQFDSIIGLGELKDFKLKNIFSEVFKKHSLTEMEDQLVTGTLSNTPAITEIKVDWAKPWLFSRLLLVSALLIFLFIVGFKTFPNTKLIPGLIFIGSFAMPLATLIFFLEMNAPRNISIFMVLLLLFIGGIASLLVALLFFDKLEFLSNTFGTPAAGIIEESAKLLIVALLLGKFRRYKWILNGLLFGAAIGTGFGAFETAGYVFNDVVGTQNFDEGVQLIILRGLLAPFMHVIWTANAAAALWMVKGDKRFEWNMLTKSRFLRVMISSMILHMVWDMDFTIIPLPLVGDVKYLILGVLAWIIAFRLIQEGLSQLNNQRHLEIQRMEAT